MKVRHISAALLIAGTWAASPATATETRTEAEKDQLVCRVEVQTGQRVGRRVCHRRSELEARTENSRAAIQEIQARPQINCVSPSGGSC